MVGSALEGVADLAQTRLAEMAWRAHLKSVSLTDIATEVARKATPQKRAAMTVWLQEKLG